MADSAVVDTVIFLGSDIVGRGENRQLGSLLMQKFLHALTGSQSGIKTILLMNDGVKLIVRDSSFLGEIKQLEERGIEVLACGTCLARFDLTDRVAAGKISNMDEITAKMLQAAKVISV
jgi:selenium metabolism protein YedF